MYSPTTSRIFGHQLRIGRQLERLGDVGLQAERAPDAADHRVTHAGRLGHRARAPVRLALRRRLQRLDNHRLDRVVGHDPRRADPRLVVQPLESAGDEPEPPFRHGASSSCAGGAPRRCPGASAHASTTRARNATARLTRARFVKRINSARSLSVSTTSALGRPIFAMPP